MRLIYDFIKERCSGSGILNSINRLVKGLYHRFGVTRDELISRVRYTFLKRSRHLKYDPEQARLEDYVAWFVYYELLTLMDECHRQLKRCKIIPLSELHTGERVSRSGASVEPYERRGSEGLTHYDSPEDEIIGKELLQMALDFFGEDDLEVLLGAKERAFEAQRLGIDYYTYCKRLKRKVQRFRTHLERGGYFD